jgi:hypothetical protein
MLLTQNGFHNWAKNRRPSIHFLHPAFSQLTRIIRQQTSVRFQEYQVGHSISFAGVTRDVLFDIHIGPSTTMNMNSSYFTNYYVARLSAKPTRKNYI